MEATNQTSPEEALRLKVELLFSRYFEHQPAEDLKTISEYFEFVAARVQIRSGEIGVDVGLEFLRHFEAVCLLLRDRLRFYPSTILQQVESVLSEDVVRVFAILSTFGPSEVNRMLNPSFIEKLNDAMPKVKVPYFTFDPVKDERFISRSNLIDAKISLSRLSQIVRYASSIQFRDYDADIEELADHYDPKLLDKAKLLALTKALI